MTGLIYTTNITNKPIDEVVKFIIVGLIATTIHLGTLFGLTEFTFLWYLPASVIGFTLAFLVSFTMQKHWTFKQAGEGRTVTQLVKYLTLQLTALTTNIVGLFILVEFFDIWYLAGQTGLLLFIAGVTFWLSKTVIFNTQSETSLNPQQYGEGI